jgi:hypothetical protein
MAGKRAREDEDEIPKAKTPRTGFKVGPDNLPDGTWKRKGKEDIKRALMATM